MRTMFNHPAPWRVAQKNELIYTVFTLGEYEAEDTCIVDANNVEVVGCSEWIRGEKAFPRMIACVNACSGISTEALENNKVVLSAKSYGEVVAQRDTLLEAMKNYLPFIPNSTAKNGGASSYSEMVKAADKFRDALAEVEGTTDGAK